MSKVDRHLDASLVNQAAPHWQNEESGLMAARFIGLGKATHRRAMATVSLAQAKELSDTDERGN